MIVYDRGALRWPLPDRAARTLYGVDTAVVSGPWPPAPGKWYDGTYEYDGLVYYDG